MSCLEKLKGRGFGNLRKGQQITDINAMRAGMLLLEHSKQFNADNVILITRELENRVYAVFVHPYDWTVRVGPEFCIWDFEVNVDEFYEASVPSPIQKGKLSTLLPLFAEA